MKTRMLGILLMGLYLLPLQAQKTEKEYLKKVLHNLEQVKSATYRKQSFSWMPGDTIPLTFYKYIKEYDNPNDTTIGASYIAFQDTARDVMTWGYDGTVKVDVFEEHKGVMIDDFTTRKLPFRPIGPPFFNYAKNILSYAFATQDSISTTLDDLGEEYHFKLIIHEDEQVEFFGKAHHLYIPFPIEDPTSQYELWIRKADNLPYKMKRTMCHNTSMTICTEVELNSLSLSDFNLYSYFPEGYEVRKRGEKRKEQPKEHSLLGKQAPEWTLRNTDGKPVSLSDIKSRVIVLNFTGIGCGACKAAIPFLNNLQKKHAPEDVSVIAIESWKLNLHSIRAYASHGKLEYPLLEGSEEVLKAYWGIDGAMPRFMILDADRVVRKVIKGYGSASTDKIITDTINECLGKSI